MSLFSRVKTRLVRDVCKALYERRVVYIRDTPPIDAGTLDYSLLSMVHTRDVLPYLVAVKSFSRQAPARRVVVVCDPSISAADRTLLKQHVRHLELRDAGEFVHPKIPRGGCWERLFAISEYVQDSYVVQLDADTITLDAVDEVVNAIQQGRGFVLGEQSDQQLEDLETVAQRAKTWLMPPVNSRHIQAIVEASLSEVGLDPASRYVRGCAGFTGFPRNPAMRQALMEFAGAMSARHGSRWADWGTEQVSSNYLVANAHETRVLPFPRYGTPDVATLQTRFLHFIGYLRFVNRSYEKATERVITELYSLAHPSS